MARWCEFALAAPRLADAVHGLLFQYGPGLAYLATIRADGGPRVHPVSPVMHDGGLYCFVIASPKRADLERDGRYALHTFPPDTSDDEAYVAGRAIRVTERELIAGLAAEMRAEPRVDWRLYELTIEVAMTVRRAAPPVAAATDRPTEYEIWRDAGYGSRMAAADSVQ